MCIADVLTVDVGGDWINNILESGPLNEMVCDTGELEDYVGGYGFHANLWVGLSDSLSVALECSTSDDYARSDGGSDEGIDILTLQLALEF